MKSGEQDYHLAPTEILRGQKVSLRLPRVDGLSFIRTLWGDSDTMAAVGGPAAFPEAKARPAPETANASASRPAPRFTLPASRLTELASAFS